MIQACNVTYRVGKKALFEDVNIKFTEGNCYGLIGANGAGKSTFLKILSGALETTNGEIVITPGQRLSVLEQDHFKYDSYPVMDVVIMGNARLYEIMKEKEAIYAKEDFTDEDGIRASELEGEFAEMDGWDAETNASMLLNGLGIESDLHYSMMSDLNGSQKVKVLLAKALCQEPEILILDEPTSYLDVKYKLEFLSMLQEMTRKKKIGVLMSLHELDLAERVSDKIVCVKGENIEHYGTPEEVFTDGFVDQLYEITDGTFQEKSGCVELKKCGGIPEVFVIAGNGTGSFLFRQLQRNGTPFAVGILGKNDIDYPAAEALAVQVIAAEAYQDFERQHYEAAKQVMCACRKVICCQTVFGSQNRLNRQLLQEAEDCGMEIELWQK